MESMYCSMQALTHVSVGVEYVVGEFEFLEGDDLSCQLVAGERWVRVRVEAGRYGRVGLAGDEPRRPVVGVAVSLAVDRHYVHQDQVARVHIHAAETQPDRRKHATVTWPAPHADKHPARKYVRLYYDVILQWTIFANFVVN